MIENLSKIAFGGGCHWCTEAVFQSINGVIHVEQGYAASIGEHNSLSEAVIVNFNTECVNIATLIEIHLLTHKSSSNHSMRGKYRSAIYTFNDVQSKEARELLEGFQKEVAGKLITQILPFGEFKPSRDSILNYYYSNPKKPFCEVFINPKLRLILNKFSDVVNLEKLHALKLTTNQ